MGFIRQWKRLGAVALNLAAAGMIVPPASAAPPGGQVSTQATQNAGQATGSEKTVRLTSNGSFKVVVRTVDGQPAGPSRMTLVPARQTGHKPVHVAIGSRGETQVSGVKPAVYRVHVNSDRYAYRGTLNVRQPTNAPGQPPQLVAFTMQPNAGGAPAPRMAPRTAPRGGFGGRRLSPAGRALAIGLAGAGIATAIAVPIATSSQ